MAQVNVSKLLGQLQATVAVSGAVDLAGDMGDGLPAGLPRPLSNPTSDPFGFVLQVAALLFGADFLETKLNGLLRQLAGTTQEPGAVEVLLKQELYRMCVAGIGDRPIPAEFVSPGYTIPVRLLDLFDLFRLEPASDEGRIAQSEFERTFVTNVLRRPGIAYRLPELPYLHFLSDASGQSVTIRFDERQGPSPGPTRLADLFADIIFSPGFRLLDPARIALDVLDVVLGLSARSRATTALEREQWLSQVVDNLSVETVSETIFDFSPPALAQVRSQVAQRRAGVTLAADCDGPVAVQVRAAEVSVPYAAGTSEPDLLLAYRNVLTSYQVTSGAPGTRTEAPVRDALTTGLAKALVLVLARNTVLAPRVWSLLLVSRLLQGGYTTSQLSVYLSKGINEVDFKDLVNGVKPLLEAAVQAVTRAGISYMGDQLLKKLQTVLRPLLQQIAGEQLAAYEAVLGSLLTQGLSAATALL